MTLTDTTILVGGQIGFILWHINHCRLFNAKSSLYIYIKYIWFGWVGSYSISNIVGYLMPNPVFIYIYIYIYMIWFGWVLWHIKHCRLFNAKSSLCIYIKYIWLVNIFCRYTQLNDQTVLFLIIQFNISQHRYFQLLLCTTNNSIISHLFTHSSWSNSFICNNSI